MDWRERYAGKLTTAEDAAAGIRSGERLWVGMFDGVPVTFGNALVSRASELKEVEISHYISIFPWITPATKDAFHLTTAFATPFDRHAVADGTADYLPLGNFAAEHLAAHHPRFDRAVVTLSPPDENGYMSFGATLWANKSICGLSKRVIAEIDPRYIRTYGDNFLHVSEVDTMWEHRPSDDLPPADPPRPPGADSVAGRICRAVAGELIRDGDCLQLGIGDVSASLAYFLGEKNDLGIQTELIPGGVMELVERGVITGARKQLAPGKVVGSAFAFASREEIARAHYHPAVELWDFSRADDLRLLVRNHHFKAINNALLVDLTGQVTAETLGRRVYSGPGGQTVFAVAASHSRGGGSVIVLPSSSRVDGTPRSRIVPFLPEGTMVTVPRTFVDHVVTEHGVARLCGRTVRERIGEMISIAHPDFRDELREEAKRLYHF